MYITSPYSFMELWLRRRAAYSITYGVELSCCKAFVTMYQVWLGHLPGKTRAGGYRHLPGNGLLGAGRPGQDAGGGGDGAIFAGATL
ncbi:MAG: hypothetical protein LUQ44_05475 [Methanothrix sp.]|nr:hypothetical protein [Methanothrix sp.]